jgi:hypothetical protein
MSELKDLIPYSGYELVAKRKQRAKPKLATARDYRNLDWEPWKQSPNLEPGQLLPRRTDWDQTGINARLAYAIMLQNRAALIKSIRIWTTTPSTNSCSIWRTRKSGCLE